MVNHLFTDTSKSLRVDDWNTRGCSLVEVGLGVGEISIDQVNSSPLFSVQLCGAGVQSVPLDFSRTDLGE